MKIDITSLCFGFKITKGNDSGTPAWATSIAQAPKDICYIQENREGLNNILYGMMFKAHSDFENLQVRNIPGLDKSEEPHGDRERMMFSVFEDVYINDKKVDGIYVLSFEKEDTISHRNRKHICYAKYLTYKGHSNKSTLKKMAKVLGCSDDACWFVYDISIKEQSKLFFSAIVVDAKSSKTYMSSKDRKIAWDNIMGRNEPDEFYRLNNPYRPYITAIKSKPFLLLAGISGTGKSRIVRELARACWEEGSEEYDAQKPKNFQMVQVKPNWHDSSDLIGYVSRVSGKAEYVAGDFLRFVAKAWEDKDTPYFLCLDEMNLAPVEQYFAEYLRVVESRKSHENGTVTTDPILEKVDEEWYFNLTASLTTDENVRKHFNESGISIPQNLIVVGTVNMDETTFSFSRKVLDRAMTIEMNDVDLHGGLTERNEKIGKLGKAELIGNAVEGVDVYADNKEVCEKVLTYLDAVNAVLNGTPFKVAYRTRNEFLLYVVNNLPYNKDENDTELEPGYVVARALDEITSMKMLSRIEGDDTKVSDDFLNLLSKTIEDGLKAVSGEEHTITSISLAKLKEMKAKLASGYTSFWS